MARRSTTKANQPETAPTDPARSTEAAKTEAMPSVVEQAQEATEQVQETVLRLSDSLRGQAVSRLGDQKEKVASGLETMSLALRTAGSEVRRQDNPLVAHYIEGAAGRLETLSGSLRENEVDALTAKVEQVARERPTLFLASALGVGLLASRLFKTSSRNQAERDRERERREEERKKHLREEEELQRAAATRADEERRSIAAEAEGDAVSVDHGGYRTDEMEPAYAADALIAGAALDDARTDVPPAPGYGGDAVGLIDEDALTEALLDPTGLGVTATDVAYDAELDSVRTGDPGRERS